MIWSGGLHPAREDNQTSGCGSFSKTLNCQLGQKSILLTQGDLVWPEKCGKPEIYLLPSLNEWETSLPKLQQLIDCFLCSCFFTVLLFVLLPYLLFVCSCLLYWIISWFVFLSVIRFFCCLCFSCRFLWKPCNLLNQLPHSIPLAGNVFSSRNALLLLVLRKQNLPEPPTLNGDWFCICKVQTKGLLY